MRAARLALIGLLGLAGCSNSGDDGRGRTILFVSLDSVRADALTFDDPLATPNLTALAESGTVFTSAFSGSSWTLPGHASMFTGMPPSLHGVEYDDIALDPAHTTLPEVLSEAGWFTAGWWTGWFLAGEYGFARGFDQYTNAMTGGAQLEASYAGALERGDTSGAGAALGMRDVASHQDITSPNVLAGFERTVTRIEPERDLFLFVHLFDPHYDYIPPAPFDTQFDPDYTGPLDGRGFFTDPRIFDASKQPPRQIGDRDLDHVRALYQGEIAYTEAQVARMFDVLDQAGRLDDALIVVTSDHGEEFFEHGNRGHRQSLYDEVLHVPLLVRAPGATAAGSRDDTLVGLQDLLPTVVEFAGLEPPTSSVGRSLLPATRSEPLADEPQLGSLLQYDPAQGHLLVDSLRTRERKLIRYLGVGDDRRLHLLTELTFELASDPGEASPRRSLVGNRDDPLWATMEAELGQLRTQYAALGPAPREDRQTRIADLFASELGDLGYSDGADAGASPGLALPWPPGPRPPVAPAREQ
ncbi:MAG: sulfatase [Planctomycetota bacterium]|nr:sulfatase [Planctomycetota bacterium]